MVGRLFAIALGLISSALGQPVIGGIVSNASYAQAPNDSSANPIGHNIIAQGSIFAVFGSGMGPATLTYASLPLPTSLPDANGTSITVTGGGKAVNAYLVYTSAGQLAAILPSTAPIGDATVTVTYARKTSKEVTTITVVKSQLGIFTANAQGTGPAAAPHRVDSSPILLTTAAKPGEVIVI